MCYDSCCYFCLRGHHVLHVHGLELSYLSKIAARVPSPPVDRYLVVCHDMLIYRAYDDGVNGEANGKLADPGSKTQMEKEKKRKQKARIAAEHVDIIGDGFWEKRAYILAAKRGEEPVG